MSLGEWITNLLRQFVSVNPPMPVETVSRAVQPKPNTIPVADLTNRTRRLGNEDAFYASIRLSKLFGPTFDGTEFRGVQEIVKDCSNCQWPLSWTAYALATAYHETAHTMKPISEYGGPSYFTKMYDVLGAKPERARRNGNTSPGDGFRYRGRGYVQLTWKNNYAKAERELGKPFVSNPDLALDPDLAGDIMIRGMSEGWFTTKKLSNYLPITGPATLAAFKSARRIINGNDKETLIAGYAVEFQKALMKGNWGKH